MYLVSLSEVYQTVSNVRFREIQAADSVGRLRLHAERMVTSHFRPTADIHDPLVTHNVAVESDRSRQVCFSVDLAEGMLKHALGHTTLSKRYLRLHFHRIWVSDIDISLG